MLGLATVLGVAVAVSSPTTAVLGLASLLGVAVAALASLAVAAFIAVYLLRNNPDAFLTFRKLRPEPDRDDDPDEFE